MTFEFGNLTFNPALEHIELIAQPVKEMLNNWQGNTSVTDFLVAEIDPSFSDTATFCAHYNIDITQTANCIIVEARRAGKTTYAGVLVPANGRANINNVVRKFLEARSVSFASKDFAVEKSKMEFGSITIVGLPTDWPLLIDKTLLDIPHLLIGGGYRKSKLLIPGKALQELPNVHIIEGLSSPLAA